MPTTIAEKTTHKFYSRGRNEKLIRQPLAMIPTAIGTQIKAQDRVAYDFAPDGRLELREGQDMLADGPPDENGQPTMQDAVSWLTQGFKLVTGDYGPHPQLNVRVWHEGHEPGRPLPTDEDFMALVTDASAALQTEPIVVALEQERATHNRPLLVAMAERAIGNIEGTRAALEAAKAENEPAE